MRILLLLGLILNTLFAIDSTYMESNSSKVSSNFFDDADGQFDMSGYLSEVYGFLPVPIVITEPALGYGAGASLMYIHDKMGIQKTESGRPIPPTVSGIIGAKTGNGTYMVAAFHQAYWFEDNLRSTTFLAYTDFNIDLYNENNPIALNMKGPILYQSLKARILDSNLFLGAGYLYADADLQLDKRFLNKVLDNSVSVASLNAIVEYDSRDDVMSPDNGMLLAMQTRFYNEAFGGDFNFNAISAQTLFYNTIASNWHIDFRLTAETVDGDKAPEYLYPFIRMRGIPNMRYQAEHTAVAEMQVGYAFTPRWRGVAFSGSGKAFGKQILQAETSFGDESLHYAGGVGFRYLIARKFGLRMGVDIAKSEQDNGIYFQFGTAWKGLK